MGSVTEVELPDASASQLGLAHPTDGEKRRTWTLNHAEWGGALGLEDYLTREPYLTTIPLSRDGGMSHWILTDTMAPPDQRPVFASVETLKKRALVAENGKVLEEMAYGIASVYTETQFRGRRYASRMLGDLGQTLKVGVQGHDQKPIASALWSDIGKKFYSKMGWLAFESLHASFPVSATEQNGHPASAADEVQPITYENLEGFCQLDEHLLRKQMAQGSETDKAKFAFIPDHDIMRWHLYRDDFICGLLFKNRQPSEMKGAAAGPEGKRVWALWTRNYHGDATETAKNKLYILRVVVEDESLPRDQIAGSFAAVMRAARQEARDWNIGKIDLWNPSPMLKGLIEACALPCEWVERQDDHIPSLMWYGEGKATDQVEWVANEKFCWC